MNGDVVSVHLDGENYNLQKKEIVGKNNEVVTEFHFTDLKQVPDWLKNSRFVVDDDWLLCITCHVFSQPGKPVTLPADMPQAESNQAVEEKPTLPSYAKQMNLIYNKQELSGHLIAANEKVFWFWQTGGSPRLYESSKLDLTSANQVMKWRYEMRQFVAPRVTTMRSLAASKTSAFSGMPRPLRSSRLAQRMAISSAGKFPPSTIPPQPSLRHPFHLLDGGKMCLFFL